MTRPAATGSSTPTALAPRGSSHARLPASGQLVFVVGPTAHGRGGQVSLLEVSGLLDPDVEVETLAIAVMAHGG